MMEVVKAGVYFLYDHDELVYIGQSNNMYQRIGEHIAQGEKKFDRFELYPTADRIRLEGFLIEMFGPKYNKAGGANWGRRNSGDLFPNHGVMEAISKYDDYLGDPYVAEIAEEIGTYNGPLLSGLVHGGAPVYQIDGKFRLDKDWYLANKSKIWDYVR